MKDVIDSILEVEKEAETLLKDARRRGADIKKECDRDLAERTRKAKEAFAGEYREKTGLLRQELEEAHRKKLEEEQALYAAPVDLTKEPYDSIVGEVVGLVARTRIPR